MGLLSKLSENTLLNLHSSTPLIRDTYSVPSNAGVYIWSVGDDTKQYVGSTINQFARFIDHAQSFLDKVNKGGQIMYSVETNHCNRYEVFDCYNYFLEFVQENPNYSLTLVEVQRLKLMTEIFPRLLEQYLLKSYPFYWNKQKTVQYSFAHLKKVQGPKEFYLKDYITGEYVYGPIYDYTHASAILDLKDWKIIQQRQRKGKPLYSPLVPMLRMGK